MSTTNQTRSEVAQALGEMVKDFARARCKGRGHPELTDSVLLGALLSEILDVNRPERQTVRMLLVTASIFTDAAAARAGLGDAPLAGATTTTQ